MRTVATGPAARSCSAIVFWVLIALIIGIAVAGQVLGPRTSMLGQVVDGSELPLRLVEQVGTVAGDWPTEADAGTTAELSFARPVDGSDLTPVRDDRVVTGAEAGSDPTATRPADAALIVRTGSLELEVGDVAASLAEARRDIAALGGYVAGSDEYDQGEGRWATVTYRVPVEEFGAAIAALRGLADRVVHESTQSAEVTATVVDLDARISNLRASEHALVEIMDRAGRIDDVLSVQSRLEEVRGRIEQLEAQRANLADQAARSTLTVSWSTPVAAVSVVQEGWDVAAELDRALAQTVEVLQGMASLVIWFALVILPLLGVPALLVLVAIIALRRRGRPAAAVE